MLDSRPHTTRPHTTVVLAMSADGKIADRHRSPARFGSTTDKAHLETQIAQVDGVLFGAGTLRAYGTTLRVTHPNLLTQRQQQGKTPQPIQIVYSQSAHLDPSYAFFRQPVPRWLLTTQAGATAWRDRPEFERILTPVPATGAFTWSTALQQLKQLGIETLLITGGGTLVAALLAEDLIDEIWLTVCPLLLGGTTAPTPVDGTGFSAALAPKLDLLSAQTIDQEVFLHYRLKQEKNLN